MSYPSHKRFGYFKKLNFFNNISTFKELENKISKISIKNKEYS